MQSLYTFAGSCGSSRNTIAEVWSLAKKKELGWPIPDSLTNSDPEEILYPERISHSGRILPDFEYIHNELAKPGANLTLLWSEYCAQCEQEHLIPYQHSQFNEKYHAFAASKKATLRIKA